MNNQETNLCGVLVHARKAKADQVRERLCAMPGTEVHAVSEDGRLVVTVEDKGRYSCADTITRFYDVEGVISTSLIYQYTDNDAFIQEAAS
jgi:nitrate reductase NapD